LDSIVNRAGHRVVKKKVFFPLGKNNTGVAFRPHRIIVVLNDHAYICVAKFLPFHKKNLLEEIIVVSVVSIVVLCGVPGRVSASPHC